MPISGGLRARLIKDSMWQMLQTSLSDLGWFDSGRRHSPINLIPREVGLDEEIPFNTLSLSDGNLFSREMELGSMLAERNWRFYIDFFAENDAIGIHMSQDVQEILEGRIPEIGRTSNTMDVLDFTQATPTELFWVEFEGISVDKAQDFPKPWQEHWYVVRTDVIYSVD